MHLRRIIVAAVTAVCVVGVTHPAAARAPWKVDIDRLVARKSVGVAVADEGRILYGRRRLRDRIPASNEKLLVAMGLLDRLGPEHEIPTVVAITPGAFADGIVEGNVWVIGGGDPTLGTAPYGDSFPFEATRLGAIARSIRDAGVTAIQGGIVGSTGYFDHDWWAEGWRWNFPQRYIALPSALSINANTVAGRHIDDPERRVAARLTRKLAALGVEVVKPPRARLAPEGLEVLVETSSAPLGDLLSFMNHYSVNFFAEILGKLLGTEWFGPLGTIDKGATAIRRWSRRRGATIAAFDSSGLSYANRISPDDLVRLLGAAEDEPWGTVLRDGLPRGGEGTLKNRLRWTRVRAKTGTLTGISALSGWVWLKKKGVWAEFSILSSGLTKTRAVRIENRIVRIVARNAG